MVRTEQSYNLNSTISTTVVGLAAICVRRNGVDSLYYVHPDRLGSYTHIIMYNLHLFLNE